jgi:SAM-dependent methyltransferase
MLWLLALKILLAFALAAYVARQAGRPDRFAGRWFASRMNVSHSTLTDWALAGLGELPDTRILDVGCGGGRTLAKLIARSRGPAVHGVDFAPGSVLLTRDTNARAIADGHAGVTRATVSHLPYREATFGLVTAFETHYYWPTPDHDLREIVQALEPGGRVLVVAELYAHGSFAWASRAVMAMLGGRVWTEDQHRRWFDSASLTDVEVRTDSRHGWIALVGRRSMSPEMPGPRPPLLIADQR